RHQVLQLRELHLKLALARPRAAREDVENELRAIDNLGVETFFEVAQLRWRQFVVEDDHIDAELITGNGERGDLAAAEKCRGVGFGTLLQDAQNDRGAGRGSQTRQFIEGMLGIEVTGGAVEQPDKRRMLLSIR